ncbi:DNA-binding protein [Candidatus Methylobacter oryzae]|uniref:DNA-binding protein n=1 Tax=Candidatus Methylobacter oryzae TaxID=2497749 RepID=A0ABY3C6E9_9GAMM|nr:DNA-binding protein [Candidatus Methylobacter oryzae]TRW90863.1 DNA-binding protein [Candidatus Methylobacter oryzae]
MNKTELENLAALRIKEAGVLLTADCYQGAYYLVGYAVECLLKACIAKQVKEFDFPDKKLANDCYTHKLADLVITAGLKQKLAEEEKRNKEFKLNWAVVVEWSEESRYKGAITKPEAYDLFTAITDNESGVLPWLKKFL